MDTEPLSLMLRLGSRFGNEVTVRPEEDGWRIGAVDPAHVAMADMRLAGPVPEAPGPFGVCCEAVLDALKGHGTADVTVDDGWIRVEADGWRRRVRLTSPEKPPRVPELECDRSCVVDSDRVRGAFRMFDSRRMPEIRLAMSPEGITLGMADDRDEAELAVPAAAMAVPPDGTATGTYPLEYWRDLMSAVPRGALLDVRMSDDWPVNVRFGTGGLSVLWMCAPRIHTGERCPG